MRSLDVLKSLLKPAIHPKRVVYTCLFGYSEPFLDFTVTHDDYTDFVCVTDDPTLHSDFWQIVQAPPSLLDPQRRSKGFKHRPHLLFPTYEYSLYIDNTVLIKQSPTVFFELLNASPSNIMLFRHYDRDCIYDEAHAVKAANYDDHAVVDEQMDYYRTLRYPTHNGLHATTVIARKHNDPTLADAMNDWHDQVLRYSKRDQLSFDVIRHFHQIKPAEFDGDLRNNDLVAWPARPNGPRLPRDFNDYIYLTLHPDVAAAGVNPRKHYLEYGLTEGRAYRNSSFMAPLVIHVDEEDDRGRALMQNGGQLNRRTFEIWRMLLTEREWDYVVDIGANYGEMLLEAPLPKRAVVLAFEPNMRIFPFLVKNVMEARVTCDCRLEALSDEDGYAELDINSTWSGLTRLSAAPHATGKQPTKTTTLATIFKNVAPDANILIKIDVEGDEIRVLRGRGQGQNREYIVALIEILHLEPNDIHWLLTEFEIQMLELSSELLRTVNVTSYEEWKNLIDEGQLYTNDIVIRKRTAL